ncbi:hypothetical protein SASPL_113745 [Salvia splendens]|uniref:Uncharacterized protein n=1 Tax=Salvia splendens TaxID=180675 RepID=A0A8X8XZF6_SALSN|nr:hypothetical protein SASPL_113745 [Salvia splendens]
MDTEPVSCPLPQMTTAAPADLYHDPSRSSLPVVVASPPPPASISLSCDFNFGYDSMELIVVDNDEAVESCPNTTIDRLPKCDQVGVEGVLLDHEETNGFLKASSRGMTIQEFCFQAQREALECIPVGLDFCETLCSYGVKAMVMYCPRRPRMRVIVGIHEVDEGAINALAEHHHIWIDIGFIECRKVGETSLGIIASLSPNRVSAKQRSCTFDPGGSISRHFARDCKKIEAFDGLETTTIQMCYHPQKYVLKLGTSVGVLALRQLCCSNGTFKSGTTF